MAERFARMHASALVALSLSLLSVEAKSHVSDNAASLATYSFNSEA